MCLFVCVSVLWRGRGNRDVLRAVLEPKHNENKRKNAAAIRARARLLRLQYIEHMVATCWLTLLL